MVVGFVDVAVVHDDRATDNTPHPLDALQGSLGLPERGIGAVRGLVLGLPVTPGRRIRTERRRSRRR
jgi:hypothetical protein